MELAHFPPRQPHDIALPWLIAMKGHPATGKSAVAHALAQRLHIPLLDKDDVKDATPRSARRQRPGVCGDVADRRDTTGAGAAASLSSRRFLTRRDMHVRARLQQDNVQIFWSLKQFLPKPSGDAGLDARVPGYATHKISGWEAMQAMLRRYDGCWQYPIAAEHHLVIDTAQPIAASVQSIIARMERA
ncbi:MAG: hypothetical protein V9G24_16190 [Rhodoblastus sp.]